MIKRTKKENSKEKLAGNVEGKFPRRKK